MRLVHNECLEVEENIFASESGMYSNYSILVLILKPTNRNYWRIENCIEATDHVLLLSLFLPVNFNFAEFKDCKKALEKKTFSYYRLEGKQKTRNQYYSCHHNYVLHLKKNRKRRLKNSGSRLIGM